MMSRDSNEYIMTCCAAQRKAAQLDNCLALNLLARDASDRFPGRYRLLYYLSHSYFIDQHT
jgi:hypothetical protein